MPGIPAPQRPRPDPALARYHRLVLFPVVGAAVVAAARTRATDEAARADLGAALTCQLGVAAVWLLHLGLQLAIGGVAWLVASHPTTEGLAQATRLVVLSGTILNVAAWMVEWGVLVAAGLRASRGHPYPLSRRDKRAIAAAERAERRTWRPLDDGQA